MLIGGADLEEGSSDQTDSDVFYDEEFITLLAFRKWQEVKRGVGMGYNPQFHLLKCCETGNFIMAKFLLESRLAKAKEEWKFEEGYPKGTHPISLAISSDILSLLSLFLQTPNSISTPKIPASPPPSILPPSKTHINMPSLPSKSPLATELSPSSRERPPSLVSPPLSPLMSPPLSPLGSPLSTPLSLPPPGMLFEVASPPTSPSKKLKGKKLYKRRQRPVRIVRKERDIAAFEDEDKEKERGGKKKKEEKDNRDTEKELGDDTDAEVSEIMDDSEACQDQGVKAVLAYTNLCSFFLRQISSATNPDVKDAYSTAWLEVEEKLLGLLPEHAKRLLKNLDDDEETGERALIRKMRSRTASLTVSLSSQSEDTSKQHEKPNVASDFYLLTVSSLDVKETTIQKFFELFLDSLVNQEEDTMSILFKIKHIRKICDTQDRSASLSIIHLLCSFGQIGLLKLLLNHGIKTNKLTVDFRCPLHFLLERGLIKATMKEVSFLDKEFYRALLVGVDPNHTLDTESEQTKKGYSLMHFAAEAVSLPLVKVLFENGASWEVENGEGKTALELAFLNKEMGEEMGDFLLQNSNDEFLKRISQKLLKQSASRGQKRVYFQLMDRIMDFSDEVFSVSGGPDAQLDDPDLPEDHCLRLRAASKEVVLSRCVESSTDVRFVELVAVTYSFSFLLIELLNKVMKYMTDTIDQEGACRFFCFIARVAGRQMEDEELSTFIPLLLQLVDSFPTRSLVERSDRRMGWLELYRDKQPGFSFIGEAKLILKELQEKRLEFASFSLPYVPFYGISLPQGVDLVQVGVKVMDKKFVGMVANCLLLWSLQMQDQIDIVDLATYPINPGGDQGEGLFFYFKMLNDLYKWVASHILHHHLSKDRASVIEFFILLAAESLKIHSYQISLGLVMALTAGPIQRLNRTWGHVCPELDKKQHQMKQIFSPVGNFSRYRALIESPSTSPPSSPSSPPSLPSNPSLSSSPFNLTESVDSLSSSSTPSGISPSSPISSSSSLSMPTSSSTCFCFLPSCPICSPTDPLSRDPSPPPSSRNSPILEPVVSFSSSSSSSNSSYSFSPPPSKRDPPSQSILEPVVSFSSSSSSPSYSFSPSPTPRRPPSNLEYSSPRSCSSSSVSSLISSTPTPSPLPSTRKNFFSSSFSHGGSPSPLPSPSSPVPDPLPPPIVSVYFGVAQRDLLYIHDASSSQVGGGKLINLIKMKNIHNCINKWFLSKSSDFSNISAPEKFSAYFATIEGSDSIDEDYLSYISHRLEPSSRSKSIKEVNPTRKTITKLKTYLPNVLESPLSLCFENPQPSTAKKKKSKTKAKTKTVPTSPYISRRTDS